MKLCLHDHKTQLILAPRAGGKYDILMWYQRRLIFRYLADSAYGVIHKYKSHD